MNPLFNDNRVKLGIMAFNCSLGSTPTMVENAWTMTWPDNVALARMADAAGFEALLPVGRWKGYPGPTNFNNRTFESFTWAAGIAAVTSQCAVLATVHVPLFHPVLAAKQAATVDHISNGRFVLNVVVGWNRDEFEMFGAEWREHDRRYEYAEEWLGLVRRLWTEEREFDFDGDFFHGRRLWSQPKPIQTPVPIMNFVMLRQKTETEDRAQIAHLKTMAMELGRRSQCWIHVYVVCRETERDARAYLDYYVRQRGDWETARNMLSVFGEQSATLEPAVLEAFQFHFIAGHGGYPLIGTPAQIVEQIERLSRMGVDGLLISWVDYLGECRQWIDEVLPLMEQAGQRRRDFP